MNKLDNEYSYIKIEVTGKTYNEQVNSINEKVDIYYTDLIKSLEQKAVRGNPTDIVGYNLAIMNDKANRIKIKSGFISQLNYLFTTEYSLID